MEYWIILLQLVPIGIFVYFYFQRKFNYWAARGVKGPSASLIKFGNMLDFSNIGQTTVEKRWSKQYGSIYGIYQFTIPILTVLDPELVKQVLVKDFHIFRNRDKNLFEHEYFDTNLFNSTDETWRRIRSITSPSFSSGKLRGMHKVMNQSVNKLSRYFEKKGAKSSNGANVNVKDMVTAFTLEVIATSSFGTETSSNGELNSTNMFVQNAIKLFDFTTWRFLAFFSLPFWVNKWLGNSLGVNSREYFERVNTKLPYLDAVIKEKKFHSMFANDRT